MSLRQDVRLMKACEWQAMTVPALRRALKDARSAYRRHHNQYTGKSEIADRCRDLHSELRRRASSQAGMAP